MTTQPDVPHLDDIIAAAMRSIAASKEPTPLRPEDPEPRHGSIVLVTSTTGTAAQRHYSDGLWYTTTGEIATHEGLFLRRDGAPRRVFLVWEAPEWDAQRPRYIPEAHDADGPE